jgi:hypothetical protein
MVKTNRDVPGPQHSEKERRMALWPKDVDSNPRSIEQAHAPRRRRLFSARGEDSSACQRLNGDSRELEQTHLSRQTGWRP